MSDDVESFPPESLHAFCVDLCLIFDDIELAGFQRQSLRRVGFAARLPSAPSASGVPDAWVDALELNPFIANLRALIDPKGRWDDQSRPRLALTAAAPGLAWLQLTARTPFDPFYWKPWVGDALLADLCDAWKASLSASLQGFVGLAFEEADAPALRPGEMLFLASQAEEPAILEASAPASAASHSGAKPWI